MIRIRQADMTEDRVLAALADMNRSVATRRHYVVAAKDFCKWMVRSHRANKSPPADLQPTVTVRPGWPIRVLVDKDILLAPYIN